jgi:hypothetical protein
MKSFDLASRLKEFRVESTLPAGLVLKDELEPTCSTSVE